MKMLFLAICLNILIHFLYSNYRFSQFLNCSKQESQKIWMKHTYNEPKNILSLYNALFQGYSELCNQWVGL